MRTLKWMILLATLAAAACSVDEAPETKAPAELPGALDSSKADWRTSFFTEIRRNIEVGTTEYDHYAADAHYYGYTFELADGDIVDIVAGDDGTGFDTVIGIYGPQRPSGEWGGLLAANDDDASGGTYDSYLQYEATASGTYLVLVRDYSWLEGDFFLSIDCAGGTCAEEPQCATEGVFCALYCPNGFATDENGCPLCRCADDPLPPIACVDGDTRPADDGCNTCTCNDGVWLCTELACTAGCQTDDDCVVTGCSGQICASEHMITTCEWRAEYACYDAPTTSCGCNDGVCGWAQTDELAACLGNL